MTNDWLNLLFSSLAIIAFMGTVFAVAKAAVLGRIRNEQGKSGSSETINRLYLASKFFTIAAVICGMAIEIGRTERAGLAGFGLLLLFAAWRRSRATDAGDVLAPVFGTSAQRNANTSSL